MTIYFENSFARAFGTWPLKGDDLANALGIALEIGYRAIDTAQMYGNEADVGSVIAQCGIPRDELCITTKVHPDNLGDDRFMASVEQSLKDLGVDQVDVLLLHWPTLGGDNKSALLSLQQAHAKGYARNVGISNYTVAMMREAKALLDVPLVTNQVEFHPLLNQDILLAAATETGIPLSSYCSVARGEVFKHDLFTALAADYGKTPAQIVLRWILQKGVSINTMSTKRANIEANFDVMGFTLSSVDMDRINQLTATGYRIVNEGLVPWAPKFD